MILGQISYVDCLVFLILLTPQLLASVGVWRTFSCALQALPFLILQLPYQFLIERYLTRKDRRSPFVQQASPFQDFVIRCVRYAFANIPASIGRVFFSKRVALPFLKFRMLRHGYLRSPIPWREIGVKGAHGLWIIPDESQKPDLVVYYCHGGGFSMGSSYFYLEFLLALVSLLTESGYRNPALFALEYTLVPDASFPTQLQQSMAGYDYVLSITGDASRVCVSGDSAGATLILSLLLHIADSPGHEKRRPGYAILISPWISIVSQNNRNTQSDYLNANSLELYGRQYAGSEANLRDPLVSPGTCKDREWWSKACPSAGLSFLYGSEEVLGPETRNLIALLRKSRCHVIAREEPGGIHAWPVATMFLSNTQAERQKGLRDVAKIVKQSIDV